VILPNIGDFAPIKVILPSEVIFCPVSVVFALDGRGSSASMPRESESLNVVFKLSRPGSVAYCASCVEQRTFDCVVEVEHGLRLGLVRGCSSHVGSRWEGRGRRRR
jgi:hypothetical protein